MIRIAAVGDLHYGGAKNNLLRKEHSFVQSFRKLNVEADLLLLAGDLTQSGKAEEIQGLIEDLAVVKIPIVAVLGNHDYNQLQQEEIASRLTEVGITVLENATHQIKLGEKTVGVAGVKGFGGGFGKMRLHLFGEPEVKEFAKQAVEQATQFAKTLEALQTDYRFVLLHYSPIEETVKGEAHEIYPFMGNDLFEEAIDLVGAHAVFHGHAHGGRECGLTRRGIMVRNVAHSIIKRPYVVYSFT